GAAAVKTTGAGHAVLIGYLAPHDPDGFDLHAAREALREQLPAALVPRLAIVADLPTRTSGKVDRLALPWPLTEDGASQTPGWDGPPLEGVARWLADCWSSVLGARVSSVEDDFFDLGGGSLAAAQLVALVRERYPRATVADLYAYPRLASQATMLTLLEPPDEAVVPRDVSPLSTGAGAAQLLIVSLLRAVTGLRWLVALLTATTLMAPLPGWNWLPIASWWILVPGVLLLHSPPGRMGLSVTACRVLLRGLRPGRYPRGGSVHLRIWGCERFSETIGAVGMAGAPWIIYYARALGAKIGRGVDLHSLPPVTGMLTLGGGCAIEPEVDLAGHWLDGDVLHVGHVRVAAHATVGARSTLGPGAKIGRGAHVEAGSCVLGSVPAAQVWAGSPSRAVKGAWQSKWPPERPLPGRRWLVAYALGAVVLGLMPLVAALPGLALVLVVVQGRDSLLDALGPALLVVPVATLAWLVTLAVLVLGSVRSLGVGLTQGFHAVRSRVGWQVWATERLLDMARNLLYPLYASLATPVWLRLLGADIGKEVEASTVLLLPAMTRVGDGAFLADDTRIASYELHQGWMRIERARVGKRAFLGNSGMTAPGRKVPKDGLVAVLSAAPPGSKAGTSWMGSPPTKLRREQTSADSSRTYAPPMHLKVIRGLVEVCRVVPVMFSVGLGVVVSLALLEAWGRSPWLAVLLAGPILIVAGLAAAAGTVLAKWLVVGKFRIGDHPLWSSFVWRNELADAFVEMLAGPWFAWPAIGSPALVFWLRAMGARIGRGVWCDTYWLPESDLVELGDGASVNRGCVLQTHLFHDRIMSMDTVTLEAGATMGPHGVILPAARLGAGATVGPASLVLRGDIVPAHTRWVGNPIVAWDGGSAGA
ncbi:MAG: phosphopantetheine-binding protein, partial [Micrococcales bacterium]|nr:phosphopantetheine-binding protein [Micrococcales bacterium]